MAENKITTSQFGDVYNGDDDERAAKIFADGKKLSEHTKAPVPIAKVEWFKDGILFDSFTGFGYVEA